MLHFSGFILAEDRARSSLALTSFSFARVHETTTAGEVSSEVGYKKGMSENAALFEMLMQNELLFRLLVPVHLFAVIWDVLVFETSFERFHCW